LAGKQLIAMRVSVLCFTIAGLGDASLDSCWAR